MHTAFKLALAASMVLATACTSSAGWDQGVDETAALSDELSGGQPVGTTLVTTANLNLRSGPSTSNAILDVMPAGSTVKTLDASPQNGFYHVSYGGTAGYAYGAYLTLQSSGGGGGSGDAVTRALTWVSAQTPYCGGTNGGHDYICGGTCSRPHESWDNYRSDCSGLVSYAWGLAAPGRTTGGFAPYDNAVSTTIPGSTLQAGDAVNVDEGGHHHVMLFWHWVDKPNGVASFIEEGNCGGVAKTITFHFVVSGSRLDFSDGRHFYAIRKK
jgi:cell wall-associated NlpC family hydrolase